MNLVTNFLNTTTTKQYQSSHRMLKNKELTIYYDMQCPYVYHNIETIKQYCETNNVLVSLIYVDTLLKAKELPCFI